MKLTKHHRLFFLSIIVMLTFSSCARVTWAAFTTPKDNLENVPKALEQYLGSPDTKGIRIFEYDKDKYMGMFIYKNSGTPQDRAMAKTNRVNIILPSDKYDNINNKPVTTSTNSNGYQFLYYTPAEGEDEIITAFNLMQFINKMKKNKNYEVYSQTHPGLNRQFFILNK